MTIRDIKSIKLPGINIEGPYQDGDFAILTGAKRDVIVYLKPRQAMKIVEFILDRMSQTMPNQPGERRQWTKH